MFLGDDQWILNIFSTLTLKQIFYKTKTFFKKLKYRFLVERTKIEKSSFPYETALSEANVKANRMVTTKWAYHRERSLFLITSLFFWKFCLIDWNNWLNNWFNVPAAQTPIFVLFLIAGVLFDGAVSILKFYFHASEVEACGIL